VYVRTSVFTCQSILANKDTNDELNAFELILASATSKVVASSAAYPHEVIRARFQSQRVEDPHRYHGVRDAVRRILVEEGVSGFYRGLPTNLMRVVPSCAITFTLYELLQRNIKLWLGGELEFDT
jgi:solute carrier family 25 (mitochondrial folate transporter), member 32